MKPISESAVKVLKERYLNKRPDGTQETFYEMLRRVADAVSTAGAKYGQTPEEITNKAGEFYREMSDLNFLPNSPCLMNAGLENGLQLSACYVLPVEDSIEGIFTAVKNGALIHQSGGGTGFSFSRLRAKGSAVKRSSGVASGPVSFLQVFDQATNVIKQGGRRRGANMGLLRVDHPDIEEFIKCKAEGGITNFNISVGITDEFMNAYNADKEYRLFDHNGHPCGTLSATRIMNMIVRYAWLNGDPGLCFLDRVNASASNPCPDIQTIEAPNACGEQFLPPYGSCNLGSINLGNFVSAPQLGVDYQRLKKTVRALVEFLDDMLDINIYPIDEVEEEAFGTRRIGLGIMGWADMLIRLKIPYDSGQALQLAREVMHFINESAHHKSRELAEERGAFPLFESSRYKGQPPIRNATLTTIAPTGSISIIADCSSGIEPLYALSYTHNNQLGRELHVVPSIVKECLPIKYLTNFQGEITHEHLTMIPAEYRDVFKTAHEIDPHCHVEMQATFQENVDNAISKSVNLPNSATEADVLSIYLKAWQTGCKGITVYRDGCRDAQVLNATKAPEVTKPEVKAPVPEPIQTIQARPRVLTGSTYRISSPMGSCFVTVNNREGDGPMEVFCRVGKGGSDVSAMTEAMGRLISVILRLPSLMPMQDRVETIISQLHGIGGSKHEGMGPHRIRSVPDAIARALIEHITPGTTTETKPQESKSDMDLCPECGSGSLSYEERCQKCHSCGYSLC